MLYRRSSKRMSRLRRLLLFDLDCWLFFFFVKKRVVKKRVAGRPVLINFDR